MIAFALCVIVGGVVGHAIFLLVLDPILAHLFDKERAQ